MPFDRWLCRLLILLLLAVWGSVSMADSPSETPSSPQKNPTLTQAVMCEDVQGSSPVRPAVVFAATIGRVYCFNLFDPVPERTTVIQTWYHRDVLITTRKLTLKPPRWATFSSIQLRESDKGPWRVEIQDSRGRVLHTLRFSITD